MIKATILNVGDEILIGQIIDTNSSFLSKKLNEINIIVDSIINIGDEEKIIIETVDNYLKKSDIVIIGGGLGPTSDDKTKYALCKYFNKKLVLNNSILEHIKKFLSKRGITTLNDNNLRQAEVPEGCELIPNLNGTAWGMIFEKNNKFCISLPGVPHEYQSMVENFLIPWLLKKFNIDYKILHHTYLTTGIPESVMSEMLKEFEKKLPNNIKLAYLPSPGILRLRLSATCHNSNDIINYENIKNELFKLIRDFCFGENDEKIEQIVGDLLKKFSSTISVAESCTGGYIQHLITSIPGSSLYFKGGIIAYSNEIKTNILNVNKNILNSKGAVSEEVVIEMANNVKKLFNTDYSIATSGIAGPTGGTDEKPVGTIWIAVSGKKSTQSQLYHFGDDRINNIKRTSIAALNMMRKLILMENC